VDVPKALLEQEFQKVQAHQGRIVVINLQSLHRPLLLACAMRDHPGSSLPELAKLPVSNLKLLILLVQTLLSPRKHTENSSEIVIIEWNSSTQNSRIPSDLFSNIGRFPLTTEPQTQTLVLVLLKRILERDKTSAPKRDSAKWVQRVPRVFRRRVGFADELQNFARIPNQPNQ
jgi:hypothetical protein